MVGLECPHCDEDIELDDDDFGLFECAHCEEEFTWENDDEAINIMPDDKISSSDLRYFIPILIFIGIIVGLYLVFHIIASDYAEAMSGFSG
jgi:hypothetical protein